MTDNEPIRQTLAAIAAQRSAALSAVNAADRTAALEAAKIQVEALAERERANLRKRLADIDVHTQSTLEALSQRAEATRRARAAALLERAFDPKSNDSLRGLIDAWRAEPSRAGTLVLQSAWRELAARCLAEVGGELADHVLGAALCDSILANEPDGLCYLGGDQFGAGSATFEALGAFAHKEQAPADAQRSLEIAESGLLDVARRGAGREVPDACRQLHEVRKRCATLRDWYREEEALKQRLERERMEKFAREYVPPERGRPVISSEVAANIADNGDLLARVRRVFA